MTLKEKIWEINFTISILILLMILLLDEHLLGKNHKSEAE